MSTRARFVGAIAGGLGVVAATACLDVNPMWIDTDGAIGTSGSGGATTVPATTGPMTSGPPTTSGPMTTGPMTTMPGTVGSSDATMGGSSGPPPACGDGAVDPGEECDDGPNNGDTAACKSSCQNAVCGDGFVCDGCGEACDDGMANADDAACTSSCKLAACGDGFVQLGVEECDDGNMDDTDACLTTCKVATCGDLFVQAGVEECDDGDMDDKDGCLADCAIPNSCREIKTKNPAAADGQYQIDPDGNGMAPLLPVECDMTIVGGGWTVIEKSSLAAPIGTALFIDKPINMGNPMMAPHRLPKQVMLALQTDANEMRIDCNGPDYLLASDSSLFAGDKVFNGCTDTAVVTFKEAKLGIGPMIANTQVCVQLRGSGEGGCPAAFGVNEKEQNLCGLPLYPFGGQPVLTPGAFAFAPDSPTKDLKHDCHKIGAVRYVMLR